MGKHAYLIIAHHNWWQLKVLLSLIDDSRNDIFIHIDKKVKDIDYSSFTDSCKQSNVTIFQKVEVSWGGTSQIECELSLFECAYEFSKNNRVAYDFYHLISGVDLPLKSQDIIHDFFDKHNEYNFIRFDDEYAETKGCIGRVRYYFFAYDLRLNHLKKVAIYIDKAIRVFQRLLHVNRMKRFPCKLYFGSNWVSIKEEAVKILLDNKAFIQKYFHLTSCADELYKHTILRESGINIYSLEKDHVKASLRYIDFSEHRPNPKTITLSDYDIVMRSGALFARKFDENTDKQVIRRIYSEIKSYDCNISKFS